MEEIKIKPINACTEVSGKFAEEIIKEAFSKPSRSAIERNKRASELLSMLRKARRG